MKNETLRRQRIKEAQEERERSENGQMHFVEKEQRKAEARARKLQLGLNPDQGTLQLLWNVAVLIHTK